MLTRSPWADQGLDPVAAARAGTSLGLDFSRLRAARDEADARTNLAYAELSQRASDASANRAQAAANAAAELQRATSQDALSAGFRNRSLASEEQRTAIDASREARQAKQDAEKKLIHAGSGIYSLDSSGNLKTELAPLKQINPIDRLRLEGLKQTHGKYVGALLNSGTRQADIPGIQAQINTLEKQMNAIDGVTPMTDFGTSEPDHGPGFLDKLGSGIGSALKSVGNFIVGEPGPSPGLDLSTPFQAPSLNLPPDSGIRILGIREQPK